MIAQSTEQTVTAPIALTVYEDPGHGWAAVPHYLLKELGIENDVSVFSYIDGAFVYLEEDCDLSLLMRAAEKQGRVIQLMEQHTDEESPIRLKRAYSKDALDSGDQLLTLNVVVELTVIDTDGKEKVINGDFNWTVLSGKTKEEIESNIRNEVDTQTKYGWLNNKKAVKAVVQRSDIVVDKPGRGVLFQQFALPEIEINF